MIFQSGRSIACLSQLKVQCLHSRQSLVSSKVDRVAGAIALLSPYSALSSYLCASVSARTYAGRPASRPKQHTGRSTSTRVPKAASKKPAAQPAAKSATKTKKATPKKPKAKRARKAKPKSKSKAKKTLTEAQKASRAVKERRNQIQKYKAQALTPPSSRSRTTAWTVFAAESVKGTKGTKPAMASAFKDAGVKYRSFQPEDLEHYNHLANQVKEQATRDYRQFIASKSPSEIKQANNARRQLKRIAKQNKNARVPPAYKVMLKDERQVKHPRIAYNYFYTERNASNDYKGMAVPTRSGLLGKEWKELSASAKKPYEDKAAADNLRYRQEVKTVLGEDVPPPKKVTT
ncbi:uncharacterized protein KY384_009208 [Bacidia gigantensis]|uniref:uncharacterized protein n=1 Tax=Bacidia gigantensis TaxID=2732470 RepID=UPI001D03EF57|nr:uncharacterized protein KY384_009208 [Bacidia gigantensis]KAG8525564.1 hypothetical protein KY384_009208 [Bacidia gigantensis]